VHYQTAWRWFRDGTLPVPAVRTATGTILVSPEVVVPPADGVGLYARVSSHDQRGALDAQVARLSEWATQAGATVVRIEAEVGSGMKGNRAKVRRMLADPTVAAVVVEHRDRLGRVNTELVEAALAAGGRRLVVLDNGECDDGLVRDMTEVLTSFCAHLYGRRSARNRAEKALRCAERDVGPMALAHERTR
jgi:putative resolvase